MSKKYAIDLPNPYDLKGTWTTYDYYGSFEEALKVAKDLMGADNNGKINIISELPCEEDDDNETE